MKYTWPTLMIVAAPSSQAWYHEALQYGIDHMMVNENVDHWIIITTVLEFPQIATRPSDTPWMQIGPVDALLVNAMRTRFGSPKSLHDIIVVDASDSKGWLPDKLRQVDGQA